MLQQWVNINLEKTLSHHKSRLMSSPTAATYQTSEEWGVYYISMPLLQLRSSDWHGLFACSPENEHKLISFLYSFYLTIVEYCLLLPFQFFDYSSPEHFHTNVSSCFTRLHLYIKPCIVFISFIHQCLAFIYQCITTLLFSIVFSTVSNLYKKQTKIITLFV